MKTNLKCIISGIGGLFLAGVLAAVGSGIPNNRDGSPTGLSCWLGLMCIVTTIASIICAAVGTTHLIDEGFYNE